MPDQENLINRPGVALGLPTVPDIALPRVGSTEPSTDYSINDYYLNKIPTHKPTGAANIPISSFYTGNRYTETRPGTDYEEMAAQQQSSWEQWRNGIAKTAGTFTTSFAAGTVGLVYGSLAAIGNQRWASLIDNDVTRLMDDASNKLEDYVPNYESHQEQDAEWYSSDNILTPNFWANKVFKNLGYSAGALAGGLAWAKVLKAIGLTNRLIQAGRGLETATAVEEAMSAVPNLQKYGAFENALNSMAQTYVKSPLSKVLLNSERILTSSMGTFGEASIEGYQNLNDFRKKAIEEYRGIYGEDPTGKALDDINKSADKVGMYTWGLNSILLTATNYIQLPKILSSSKSAERVLINDIKKEVGGDWLQKVATTKFGKVVDGIRGVSRLAFSPIESFEEGAQFSIQMGVNDYFKRAYDNKDNVKSFLSTINEVGNNVFGEGIEKTLSSKEGMESILIGGISGGLQQIRSNIKEGGVFGEGGQKQQDTILALDALNKTNIKKTLQDQAKFLGIAIGSQELRQQAVINNDKLSEKNLEHDYTLSYLMPRAKYGKIDSVFNELDSYEKQAMDDQGFRQLGIDGIVNENETKDQFLARIATLKETARSVDQLYSTINDKYSGIYNDKGEQVYGDGAIDRMVYAASKIRDFDKRVPSLNAKLVSSKILAQNILDEVVKTGTLDVDAYNATMTSIDAMQTITSDERNDLKQDLQDLAELALQRKQFVDEYDKIKLAPQEYSDIPYEDPDPIDESAPKEKIKVKTKRGEIIVDTNTEYYIGRVAQYDKNGQPVYSLPKFTILADNGDGTILIRDNNGERNVDKSKLEDYNLGRLSDLEKDKKGKFFFENWNTIYKHKGIKDSKGKPYQGRLVYSPKDRVLLFEYVNEKGKVRTIEVTGDKFVAQKGFTNPMVEAVSKLTAAQQASLTEYSANKDELSDAIQRRKDVVVDLVKASEERLQEVNNQLNKAKESITQIDEALQNAMFTKKGLPRKNLKAIKKTIDQLAKQKEAIEKTIDTLEDEREELEGQLPYMQSLLEYAETLPDNFKDAISDLKDDIGAVEEMIELTNNSIKKGKSLLDNINNVLKEALSIFNDFVVRLKEENPGIPIFITDFQANIEKFLGEEGVADFINQKQGYTQVVLDLQDQISEFNEEMNIPNLEKRSQALAKRIPELETQLTELIEESIAKGKLLAAFETTVKQIEEQRAQQELLRQSETFVNAILGTHDISQRNIEEETGFEEDSKKTNINVVRSGIPSQNLPGYANANQFGNNLEEFKNKDQLKTILITSTNEAKYGLEGLTKHIAQGKDELSKDDPQYIDPSQTIVMVMVEEGKDGVLRLVGVDGKVLEETATFENTVYQVMPSEKLQWSEEFDNKSMFRKDTNPKIVESLKKQYKEWRDGILANPPIKPFGIQASFGIPERVTVKNDSGIDVPDTGARVGVEDSGLVSEDELQDRSVIVVPTLNSTISRGTTSFKNALGMVFLKMRNGYVRLQNRKFSQKEVTTIYQAIERVSTLMFEDEDVKGEETQRLLNWLKSVVYWGTPKDINGNRKKAGFNSIWFENIKEEGSQVGELRLVFSKNENSIPFTPQYLRENRAQVIALIQKLYNNTNSTKAIGTTKVSWNKPYEEILEVKTDGTLVTRDWPNYQTFLLSSKMPDADGNLTLKRPIDELPLVTQIKPKTNPSETNRKSVYFILKDIKYTEPNLAPAPPPAAPVTKIVPGAGAAGVVKEAKEGTIDLTPNVVNTYVSPITVVDGVQRGGKKIKWKYDSTKEGLDVILLVTGGDTLESIESAKAQLKERFPDDTEEQNKKKAGYAIKGKILQTIPPGATDQFKGGGITIPDDGAGGGFFDSQDKEDIDTNTDEETGSGFVIPDDTESTPEEEAPKEETGGFKFNEAGPENDDDIEDDMRGMDIPHDLRVLVEEDVDRFESENWNKVEQWLKANFPNLPVYRVKNILKATNGLQAWGMLKKGALYIYENAEVGTIYHEVFEGVIKYFTSPREVRAILKEFRSRKGTFIDRPTGREIEYKNASYTQAKEQLAEEFRDYVQEGKIPPKPVDKKPLVVRLFADMVNTVKNFFANTPNAKNNTERLFEKIGTGYYKTHSPYTAKLSFAEKGIIDIENALIDGDSELRLKLRGETIHDIMQQMTYMTLRSLVGNNEGLFALERVPKRDLYKKLKHNVGQTILLRARAYKEAELLSKEERKLPAEQKVKLIRQRKLEMSKKGDLTYKSKIAEGVELWKSTMRQWENIVAKHEEYLKSYSIEFDENEEAIMKSDENTGRGEYEGAHKIDHFRKTNSAIKLLLSTLPMVEGGKVQFSSINGVKLLPLSKVYMSLMNNLHTSRSPDEMLERVREMALGDENYRLLYSRLTGTDYATKTVNLEDIEDMYDLQLLSAFWKTFKKQSPDVRAIFIFENGDVTISDSNFASAGRQIQQEFENAMKIKFRSKNKYFKFDTDKKVYVGVAESITKDLESTAAKVAFLKELGIEFTEDEINNLSLDKKKTFDDVVDGIRKSISQAAVLGSISGKVLNVEGRMLALGLIRAQINNPEFDSTFFNVNGERTQTFIGTNPISDMFDVIHQVEDLTELAGTQYEYLLTDDFAQDSVIINRMFNVKRDASGSITSAKRREDILNYLKGAYADGTVDLDNGKRKQSSSLTYKQRMVQEINMNLNGYFSNLVPGDASMEHMAFMGNAVTSDELLSGFKSTFKIFKGYFISEVMLSRSDRAIVDLKGRKETDLRFFKSILGETLHNKIVNDDRNLSPEALHKAYENQINNAVEEFIKKEAESTKRILFNYGILEVSPEEDLVSNGIDFEGKDKLTEASLNRQLNALSINYIVSNIELHKLLYSDPYQYSDELKRIKNFLSPRQTILNNSLTMNAAMNKVFNKGYNEDDVAYTDMNRDFFRSLVFQEVLAEHDLPGYEEAMYKEADGAGIIIDKAYRNMRFRSGEWNTDEEKQFRYDMAWYKNYKGEGLSQEQKEERGITLSKEEEAILEKGNPSVRSAYTTKKPIVAGNKADGNSYNDVVLDKFALYPLSYRIMYESAPRDKDGNVLETNAMKLYDKMLAEDIDYGVFESGRKVGTTKAYDVYNSDGSFNNTPYDTVNNIPFSIFSIQSEIPSKEDGDVTRGTQPTKLMTLDFMEAGVPVDFMTGEKNFDKRFAKWIALKSETERENNSELYKEIKNNQLLLEAMIDNGYYSLLKRMGIAETINGKKKSFEIVDPSSVAKTLREEMLKRETNDNISEALTGFLNGDAVLEATPAYQQIRNILYSIADKEVISQKITGGQKIQIPSVFMEDNRIAPKIINGKKVYTSEALDFYKKDGKQVCEIMISRWFDSPLSDQELLDYLNNTAEGQKILAGLAFRIPSQKQNSIESFVIKRFLPKEFGDNVVIPGPLVQKAGSDFDIDKLFMYLKNVFVGKDGKPRLIEFLTDKNSTTEERYVHWVRANANRDTKGYIKFLTRQAIQNLKTNFNLEFARVQAEYQNKRIDNTEDLYKDMVKDIQSKSISKTTDQEEYLEQLFSVGHRVFFAMNEISRDPFWELKTEIKYRGIKGPDEIRRYLALAISMTQDSNTIEDDIIRLENLIKIYNEELRVMGIKQEIIDQIRKDAVESFRKEKDVLKYALKLDVTEGFDTLSNLYEEAKDRENFIAAQEVANIDELPSFDEFRTRSIYDQNTKKALQNGYVQSSQNLVSNPANFDQLVKPNSAQQAKDLAADITKKRGLESFDYSSTGNMLSRGFMTRLRHAFVTGKYAIGIAAVNQTNHSLNQRQPIYINDEMLESLSEEDQMWLRDAKINFKEYNSMKIKGKQVPILSMIKNKAGEFISDLIGQFIDGYVDISKGPWIMELGATPNVASTWLFLIKLGVPLKTVGYFMNQPIVRDYLSTIENAGYSWLFIDTFFSDMVETYGTIEASDKTIPSEKLLGEMVGKEKSELTAQQKAQQVLILKEFLKYARMASHMFMVTQGSNFDTSTFNDPYLIFKKIEQYKLAQNTIISSVDDLINNSFLKKLSGTISDIRNAYSEILQSDRNNVRNVIEPILRPYVTMSDRDFVKIAQKVVLDLFDWAVQTDRGFNRTISNILLSDKNAAEQVSKFIDSVKKDPKHPLRNNYVINSLVHSVENDVNNLSLKNRDNKVYDQNQIIYGFSEIKEYLEGRGNIDLYKRLVLQSVLQSGLSNSKIAFTSLLPYEDFKEIYNKTLSKLNNISNLQQFRELGVFERNNWNNEDIVPKSRAIWIKVPDFEYGERWQYNPSMAFLPNTVKEGIESGEIPQAVSITSTLAESQGDYIVYSWEKTEEEMLTKEEMKLPYKRRRELVKEKKTAMRKRADYSYLRKGLFKRVYDGTIPYLHAYTTSKGELREYHIYSMINAWGDSFRANEFYDVARPSVIDNNFLPVKQEGDDGAIVELFENDKVTKAAKKIKRDAYYAKRAERAVSTTPTQQAQIAYKGNFEDTGKGTPEGDGKDKAMRNVADGFIGRLKNSYNGKTSSNTSYTEIGDRNGGRFTTYGIPHVNLENAKVVMLASNKEFSGEELTQPIKDLILQAKNNKAKFVVGDMPGVDSQFIDYLQEIGAKFTIYHTGATSRIKVKETTQPSTSIEPKGEKVKDGIYVNQEGLTKEEQLELFDYLKPVLEKQAIRSNTSKKAPKMAGLGLNWDYINNRPTQTRVDVKGALRQNNTYGWFEQSANGLPLEKISPRLRELMAKATGIDISNYDGSIVNIYRDADFITNHPDIDESKTAEKYPVVVVNIGGTGNIILGTDKANDSKDLKSGAGYLFGFQGKNRTIPHSTYASSTNGFLPAITTEIDGETYAAGSYRISITMRRVMPLETGMPTEPSVISSKKTSTSVKAGIVSEQPVTASEAGIRARINELETLLKTTGIGPAQATLLRKLQIQLGNIVKNKC